jgi:hypothetical protein
MLINASLTVGEHTASSFGEAPPMWRGIILFACVCAAVLATSPAAWWLVAAEFGAAPSVRYGADSSATPALSGKAAPWPDWAAVPHAKQVIPRYWEPMQGFGVAHFAGEAYAARESVAKALRDEGWTVQFWHQILLDPKAPATAQVACMMRAWFPSAPERVLHVHFSPDSKAPGAEVYWFLSLVKQIKVGAPEPC